MAMQADEIEGMIKAALPDALVEITDLAGDGNHYAARVVSDSFRRLPASNSIRRFMTRWADEWAAFCMPCSLRQPFLRIRIFGVLFMSVHDRIEEIVKGNNVVLFMKGSPLFPQCGFSSKAIAILDHLNVAYESVDVLQDMEIRAAIKDYSDWPTIPQLYVKGEFLGGSDIMMEMYDAGELQELVETEGLAKPA